MVLMQAGAATTFGPVHAGFMLFVALTVLTIYAQPAPLKLGAQKLALLEERVLAAGKAGWQVRQIVKEGLCGSSSKSNRSKYAAEAACLCACPLGMLQIEQSQGTP